MSAPSFKGRAEAIAINALGLNNRAELDPGEKLAFGIVAAEIEHLVFDAEREVRVEIGKALHIMQRSVGLKPERRNSDEEVREAVEMLLQCWRMHFAEVMAEDVSARAAENAATPRPRHVSIVNPTYGPIGCMTDPTPEDEAHALQENHPDCFLTVSAAEHCEMCREDATATKENE